MFDVEGAMATPVSRRRLLEIGGALGLAGLAVKILPQAGFAQTSADNSGGYPELAVSIEDQAIQVPAQVPAGMTFVSLNNSSKNGELVVAWGRLASDLSKDDVTAALAAPVPATPTSSNADPVVALLKTGKIALIGAPQAPAPGKTNSGIVRLEEGPHVLFDVFSNRAAFFDVTAAEEGAKTDEPKAELTVKLGNMVFLGLDDGVPAGKHLWRVENIDKMEHELIIAAIEPGMTADDVKSFLEQATTESGDDGTPPPGAEQSGGDQPGGGASVMSAGQVTWQVVDLPAGHYAAFCMVPMDWSGPPHALMGMIKVFDAK